MWASGSDPRPHASSRIEPRLAPRRARRLAGELDPVVQAERAVLPKLDRERRQAVAGPIRWSRYGPDGELGGGQRDRLFQRVATLEWRRLLAGPGADLGKARAGGEIGIGLGIANPRDRTAQPHLSVRRLPMEQQRALAACVEFPALRAVDVGVEHPSPL